MTPEIVDNVACKNDIFGNFVVRSKGARKGRNPRTGEEIGITPRRVVTFRPSQVFKKYVNHS